MTYRKGTILHHSEYNFLLEKGGMGDLIAQLPAVKYSLDNHPQLLVNLWVHNYGAELCKKAFEKYDRVTVYSLKEYEEKFNKNLYGRSPYAHRIGNLAWHMTDHAFATIVGKQVEAKDKNYIQIEPINVSSFNLPEKYMVVTTGFTSKARRWRRESISEVCDYITKIGYTPVFLGKSFTEAYNGEGITGNFDIDESKGISLIDKTSLLEAHGIMARAKCVIGVDNGLLHLGAMSEVPIIYAFTSVIKEHRLPYRHNEMGWNCYPIESKELKCFGCQSNCSFPPIDHDFRNCMYEVDAYKCVDLLTSDKFIEQIKKVLEPKTPQEKADKAYEEILITQELNRKLKEIGVTYETK